MKPLAGTVLVGDATWSVSAFTPAEIVAEIAPEFEVPMEALYDLMTRLNNYFAPFEVQVLAERGRRGTRVRIVQHRLLNSPRGYELLEKARVWLDVRPSKEAQDNPAVVRVQLAEGCVATAFSAQSLSELLQRQLGGNWRVSLAPGCPGQVLVARDGEQEGQPGVAFSPEERVAVAEFVQAHAVLLAPVADETAREGA